MSHSPEHFSQPVMNFARQDFTTLDERLNVQQALEEIRRQGIGERIIYFYVVNETGKLTGVLPTRRLLTSQADQPLSEVIVRRVAAIPHTATMLEACESFVLYKFLAFPVVDAERHVVGVVDVSLLTEELLNFDDDGSEPSAAKAGESAEAANRRPDEVFELLGFHLSQLRGASPAQVFRYRFPWLLATIGSGTLCALLTGAFEETLARSLVIAFFLTMVLGLNESVSIQTMSVTIQALRTASLSWRWYFGSLRREMTSALLLAGGCGATVAVIVWAWQRAPLAAGVIGGSISLSLLTATLFGVSVPTMLHALKLDPKIAAGPVTLALADLFALIFYFSLAKLLL
jgi:magnesium transporter